MNIILLIKSYRQDDVEDNSPLRRSRPSTHSIFGIAQTVNSSTYGVVEVLRRSSETTNPDFLKFVIGTCMSIHLPR